MTLEEKTLLEIEFKNKCFEKDINGINKMISDNEGTPFVYEMIKVGHDHASKYRYQEIVEYLEETYPEAFV